MSLTYSTHNADKPNNSVYLVVSGNLKKNMGIFDGLFGKKKDTGKITFNGKVYESNPEAQIHFKNGLDKYQLKDYRGTVESLSKAINLMPNNQNFYTIRGTAYEDMGNDIEAEKDFKNALDINPKDFLASYRLGMVYSREKDFESAVKWLKVSHQNAINVKDLETVGLGRNTLLFVGKHVICGNLGNILVQLKRIEEGLIYLNEAIKIDPQYPYPYFIKGMAFVKLNQPKEAMPFLKKAESMGMAQASTVMQMLAQQDSNQNNKNEFDETENESDSSDDRVFTKGSIKEGENAFKKGKYFAEKGNLTEAIVQYSISIAHLPFDADILENVYWHRAQAYYELNYPELASHDYTEVIELNPNYLIPYMLRGECYRKLKYWKGAIVDYNEALKLESNYWHKVVEQSTNKNGDLERIKIKHEIHFGLGMAYNQIIDFKNSLVHFQEAYAIKPNPDMASVINDLKERIKRLGL